MAITLKTTISPGKTPIYTTDDGLSTSISQDPAWIQLPAKFGGQRADVIDKFVAKVCQCGQHPAKVYVLKGKYMVAECTQNGWAWFEKPADLAAFKKSLTTK